VVGRWRDGARHGIYERGDAAWTVARVDASAVIGKVVALWQNKRRVPLSSPPPSRVRRQARMARLMGRMIRTLPLRRKPWPLGRRVSEWAKRRLR
jgi:hypothetical protein